MFDAQIPRTGWRLGSPSVSRGRLPIVRNRYLTTYVQGVAILVVANGVVTLVLVWVLESPG